MRELRKALTEGADEAGSGIGVSDGIHSLSMQNHSNPICGADNKDIAFVYPNTGV